MNSVAEQSKDHLLAAVESAGPKYVYLLRHLPEVEKWVKKITLTKPEANLEVLLTSVWLHDIGQMVGSKEVDHAINSEEETRIYLPTLGVEEGFVSSVAHCVRAHRCKDVQPETLEAKILAVSDSASHMTDIVYIDMASRGDLELAKGKLERDYRDVGIFPDIKDQITPLYMAWKKLLEVYPLS